MKNHYKLFLQSKILLLFLVSFLFNTEIIAQCINPSSLVASNISSNSFQVNWQGTNPDGYEIYESISNVFNPNLLPTPTYTTANATLISNLLDNYTYYIWVKAFCPGTTTTPIGPIAVTTLANTTFCNEATYGLFPQTTFTPTCTGTPETITAQGFASEFSKVNVNNNSQYTFSSSNSTDYITITNEAGTAVYDAGNTPRIWNSGSLGGVIRFHTYTSSSCGSQAANRTRFIKCAPCALPTNVTATTITSNSVTLNISVATAATAGYEYIVKTLNAAPIATSIPTGNSPSLNPIVTGLTASTVYFYWVRSNCGSVKSAWLAGGSFTTSIAPPICQPPPPAANNNFSVTDITTNSADFYWSLPSDISYSDMYFNTASTPPTSATVPSVPNRYILDNHLISGFLPNTTYYWWIRSRCSSSFFSVWVLGGSFTTKASITGGCNSASNGRVDTFLTSPNCAGTPEEFAPGMAAGQFFNFNILTNKQYTLTCAFSSYFFTLTDSTGTTLIASGLSPFTWFSGTNSGQVRLFLHTNSLCGSSTVDAGPVTITCQNATATCFPPSGLVASASTATTANVSWTAPASVPSNGYQYYYNTVATAPISSTTPTGNSTQNSTALTGLNSNTTYYLWVRSNCGGIKSTWVGSSFSTVASGICNNPSGLSVSTITTAAVTLNWLAPNTVPGNGYQYYYSTNNIAPSATTTPTGTSTTLSATLTGLSSNTVYYYWLRSNCGTNQSTWTSGNSFITLTPVLAINDTCSSSINLLPASNFANGAVNGSLLNATTTAGITPSCQANFSSDVWYKVIVPSSGSITLETKAAATNTATDTVLAVFSGNCGTLTQIGCNDDKVANNNLFSLLSLTGQTPGATLYVGVWKFQTDAPTSTSSNFQIAAYSSNLANENFEVDGLKIYPNPVKDILNLSFNKEISNISIYNILGQEVISKSIKANESQIDTSRLSSGAYFVKVYADNLVKTIKVIKE